MDLIQAPLTAMHTIPTLVDDKLYVFGRICSGVATSNPCKLFSAYNTAGTNQLTYMVTTAKKSTVPNPFTDGRFIYPTGATMTNTNAGSESIIVVSTLPDVLAETTQSGRIMYIAFTHVPGGVKVPVVVS